ncbi:hypothetical protein Dsin_002054 [Dipteronia sinensis]|uniref:RNase H type-1 domain-containing protein n=1 Tax=Dipteronia sinensis TaxID=43782 RepID=A0AAE0B541_9ROSI|nr:hypothetical protein Dsin_002054 [Dipteronia sinensis]
MGYFKVNTNAAVDVVSGKVGIGMVIRDHLREVLASGSQPIMVGLSPDIAEAHVIYRGLIFAKDSGLLPCMVESDPQVVDKLINWCDIPISDIGTLISDIRFFGGCHSNCRIVFPPRKTNMVAHNLAKFGLTIDDDLFSMEEIPRCVASIVLGDRPTQL